MNYYSLAYGTKIADIYGRLQTAHGEPPQTRAPGISNIETTLEWERHHQFHLSAHLVRWWWFFRSKKTIRCQQLLVKNILRHILYIKKTKTIKLRLLRIREL